MSGEDEWLTFEKATEIVRGRTGGSIGRSESVVKAAKASTEVRFCNPANPMLLRSDDGVVGMSLRPGSETTYYQISKHDLLDWLDRHHTEAVASPDAKPRARNKRSRVASAIQELWPNRPPDQLVLSNSLLCKKVGDWLKADCQKKNVPVAIPSDDTILRAAGRK